MYLFNKTCPVFPVLWLLMLLFPVLAGCAGSSGTAELNVAAAASLADALKEINTLYMQNHKNITITANFASSGTLQKQIEQGAPADVFISAGASQMDALQKERLLIDETRQNLLKNKLVLVVPVNRPLTVPDFKDLAGNSIKKIAIGDPQFVPAGTYAQQTFDLLGITTQVKPKLVLGADVRQVLAYVESGNVDAGIVYATDAITTNKVKIVASAPEEINDKVMYPAAVIRASQNVSSAKAYLDYLSGVQSKTIFEKYGFTVISK